MEYLVIKGDNGNSIKIIYAEVYGFPSKTCHFGGYDVRAKVEIKSGGFSVNKDFYTSTGEIYTFFDKVKICNQELKGAAKYASYEEDLEFVLTYDNFGKVAVKGFFKDNYLKNILNFEFNSDQTYISEFINEFQQTINKYGNNLGIK